jgi:peptidoglycan hydrolase CwlO-like protein
LEEMQQAERDLKKLKKDIEKMESERTSANERLEKIKQVMKGYEKRSTGMCIYSSRP